VNAIGESNNFIDKKKIDGGAVMNDARRVDDDL
jgi:hypothetical protein